MAIYLIDPVNGNEANPGTYLEGANNNLRAKKLFSSITLAVGDTVRFPHSGFPSLVSGNAQATWNDTAKSIPVTWNTQQLKVIDNCDTAWTLAAGQSSTDLSSGAYKKSDAVTKTIRIGKAVNTVGLIAYRTLPAAVDFSAYQQVSFWVRASVGGTYSLRLCSDTAGATAVHTFQIPSLPGNRWTVFTFDAGSNLPSSVRSIALYAESVSGAQFISFDNILACKSGGLTLSSLIGKGTVGETYYGIASIENISATGCTIWLDNQTETLGSAGRGYSSQRYWDGSNWVGFNETLPLWKREPIPISQMGTALTLTTAIFPVALGGTSPEQMISYEFGYSDFNLPVADSETWFDGQCGVGGLFVLSTNRSYVAATRVGGVRLNTAFSVGSQSRGLVFRVAGANNNASGGFISSAVSQSTFEIAAANNNAGSGFTDAGNNNDIKFGQANNNGVYGAAVGWSSRFSPLFDRIGLLNDVSGSIFTGENSTIYNADGAIVVGQAPGGINYLVGCSATPGASFNSKISVRNQPGSGDNIITDGAQWFRIQDADRYTPTGSALRCNVTSSTRHSAYPASLRIARIAVVAGRTVTIRSRMKRDSWKAASRLWVPDYPLTVAPTPIISASLRNGSFETLGTGGQLFSDWLVRPSAGDSAAVETANQYSGARCFRFDYGNTSNTQALHQDGILTIGHHYKLSFAVRNTSGSLQLQLGNVTQSYAFSTTPTVWTKYNVDFCSAESDLYFVRQSNANNSSLYIDDVQLDDITLPCELTEAPGVYQQVSYTFTPTETGFVDAYWDCWEMSKPNTTVKAFLDDVTIEGAATGSEINSLDMFDRGILSLANVSGGGMTNINFNGGFN